jgi:hypothetical protein
MAIFNHLFNRKPNASLDSVGFDSARHRFGGEANGQRTWFTPDGDGIGLFFFPKRPDLPVHAKTISELQEFYRGRVCNEQVKMVEFRLSPVIDITCIWMVLKIPRKPHGMTYLGSLTIPFAEFSFVIKMQCEERGITGVRETALLIKAQEEGSVALAADGKLTGNWNPDDSRYDDKFPDHRVSRLRREFALIIATLQLREGTKNEKRFELPT